jgi:hypothetical protein
VTRLFGAAADAGLNEAWQAIFRGDPAAQQIIHVLAPPAGAQTPAWLDGFAAYEAWQRDGRVAGAETWRAFADTAAGWPYVGNARRAAAAGIPNVRIYVLERDGWAAAPAWHRYLAEAHAPGISAMAGETLYRVWREDLRDAGLPDRDCDANIWGAAVMLTGYRDGDVDWREFLSGDGEGDLARFAAERAFVTAVRDFAAAHCERAELPSLTAP